MVVVVIVGVLIAITIPAWAKSRNSSRAKVCVSQLRQLYNAKIQWATEFKMTDEDVPQGSDVLPYLRGGMMPTCPIDGVYNLRRVSRYPTCSFYTIGHTLSPENPDEDAALD